MDAIGCRRVIAAVLGVAGLIVLLGVAEWWADHPQADLRDVLRHRWQRVIGGTFVCWWAFAVWQGIPVIPIPAPAFRRRKYVVRARGRRR